METGKQKTSLKAKIQKLGTALSGMVMPNIAAIIAWGLITAIFMEKGWFPNKQIAELIDPMLDYLLPLLIGYVGGRMVDEERGAIVGAIATMGVVVGSDVPMFLGAMIMGPLGGYCIKKLDELFQAKIRSGFEMIYNNFSSGIMGMLLAILGVYIVNPIVSSGSHLMSQGVDWIISIHMLPLANIFIEPAKVLFLNNAIGNGILVPLGVQQVASAGKSVLFLLESNPGPGLGVLLAFMFFGKGNAKASAPGAVVIQFIGGIHEIYFPYILMKPALFLAVIAGGVTGTFTFQLFGAGLRAAASPGSIIAIMMMTAQGSYLGVLAGIASAAIVSFIIAAIILKADRKSEGDDEFAAKQREMKQMKAESKGQATETTDLTDYANVKKIIFACDAGMGSSAMGASLLRDKVKKAGLNEISVTNTAVSRLKDEPNLLVVTQEELAERAAQKTPHAVHIQVGNFLNSPKYDEIIAKLKTSTYLEPETNSPETKAKPELELDQVEEIDFIRHDQNRGTSTMAVSLLKDKLHEQGKNIPVKAVRLADLKDDHHHLVIVTKEAQKNLEVRYTNVQVLVVSDLLDLDVLLEKL
ncbi:PTS mannitol transporter subunit IICBA [Ligilactobacillus faecis]|uniref:PTS mannitol transporter subunit IICBA n=1 Tax=Ligilactobacillus faecis TaxID=762833 RepID=UPI00246986A7|nr:PTS mannitol transporter subunit IICBA [Ligilactobacillus faecis]WGN90438.1 PTS mannitol transporter subunit IICBA [Ligilactobacillus faecis]